MNIPPHIKAIFQEYLGKRDLAVADLQVYLRSTAGIGDHENIGESIKNKILEIDKYDSLLNTIMNMYPNIGGEPQKEEEEEPKQPQQTSGAKTDLYEDGRIIGSFKKSQNS